MIVIFVNIFNVLNYLNTEVTMVVLRELNVVEILARPLDEVICILLP